MIIDRRVLFLFAFNFTNLDIEHSRTFAVITKNSKLVQEAGKLFEADTKRQPYTPSLATFVVSPLNARKELSSFLKAARKELLIYDPKISDPAMIRLLEERGKAGVEIKIIGKLTRKSGTMKVCSPPSGCIPAPLFGTNSRCLSVVRVFGNLNWMHGGKSESYSGILKL